MNKNEILNYIGIFCLFSVFFVSGFYFGYKSSSSKQSGITATTDEIRAIADKVDNQEVTKVNVLDTPGVFWIKVGEPPICPQTHPIKGKFDSSVNIYYLQDHQSYDNVKAHICFVDENTAKEQAGFIRRY